jgi:hypothetical protein
VPLASSSSVPTYVLGYNWEIGIMLTASLLHICKEIRDDLLRWGHSTGEANRHWSEAREVDPVLLRSMSNPWAIHEQSMSNEKHHPQLRTNFWKRVLFYKQHSKPVILWAITPDNASKMHISAVMAPRWPKVNISPENINKHTIYLKEACN